MIVAVVGRWWRRGTMIVTMGIFPHRLDHGGVGAAAPDDGQSSGGQKNGGKAAGSSHLFFPHSAIAV